MTIEYKTFNDSKSMDLNLRDMNNWRTANPMVRVISIETMIKVFGAQYDGREADSKETGFRVWFYTH